MEVEEIREEVREELESSAARERWIGYLALTAVILAVCATLSSFKEGNNSVDSVLNQTQAANQWAYYQAKSIKGYLYEMQNQKLGFDLIALGQSASPEVIEEIKKTRLFYDESIKRYDEEKKGIMAQAREYERLRDDAQRRAESYGIAVIFLQMGILLCSLSALMKRKLLWLAGGIVGIVGVVYFVDGFFLFMR